MGEIALEGAGTIVVLALGAALVAVILKAAGLVPTKKGKK